MKLKSAVLLSLVTLVAALLPQAAHADSLTLTLSTPTQSVSTTGGTLSYSGTISAAATNTGFEYLNGDSFTFNSPGIFDDSGFLNNAPLFLPAGQSYTGLLFTVTYGSGSFAGIYPAFFSILGGGNDSAQNTLATASFQANVTAPAIAATPEPSSFLLLGTAMLGGLTIMRRRYQPTAGN